MDKTDKVCSPSLKPPTRDSCDDLSPEEISRYKRHLSLPEIGVKGQKLLKASSLLCVGSGGLGSPILLYLAAAGIGRLGIVDFDNVEISNLQRQIIHGTSWINKPKITSAKDRILETNPHCKVETFETSLNEKNALEIISQFDLVCDCTDNFPSRYLINDACTILGKPNIYGSVAGFEGQVSVFNLDSNSPNYRDLVPEPPPSELIPSCEEGGVLGVMPGIIGLIQATEAIKIITKTGTPLNGRLLVVNALSMSFKELTLCRNPERKKIAHLIDYSEFCSNTIKDNYSSKLLEVENVSVKELKSLLKSGPDSISLIDVRTYAEALINSIPGAKLIPLQSIKSGESINEIRELASKRKLFIHCKSGKRSIKALIELRKYGINGVNVEGGIDAWGSEFPANSNC